MENNKNVILKSYKFIFHEIMYFSNILGGIVTAMRRLLPFTILEKLSILILGRGKKQFLNMFIDNWIFIFSILRDFDNRDDYYRQA